MNHFCLESVYDNAKRLVQESAVSMNSIEDEGGIRGEMENLTHKMSSSLSSMLLISFIQLFSI